MGLKPRMTDELCSLSDRLSVGVGACLNMQVLMLSACKRELEAVACQCKPCSMCQCLGVSLGCSTGCICACQVWSHQSCLMPTWSNQPGKQNDACRQEAWKALEVGKMCKSKGNSIALWQKLTGLCMLKQSPSSNAFTVWYRGKEMLLQLLLCVAVSHGHHLQSQVRPPECHNPSCISGMAVLVDTGLDEVPKGALQICTMALPEIACPITVCVLALG